MKQQLEQLEQLELYPGSDPLAAHSRQLQSVRDFLDSLRQSQQAAQASRNSTSMPPANGTAVARPRLGAALLRGPMEALDRIREALGRTSSTVLQCRRMPPQGRQYCESYYKATTASERFYRATLWSRGDPASCECLPPS